MGKIIVVLNDLFFATKVRVIASKLDIALLIIKNREDLLNAIETSEVEKLILDLNFNKFDAMEVLKEIDTHNIYVIGFLSHVQVELIKKAEKYCDLVLARSDFFKRLPELLL